VKPYTSLVGRQETRAIAQISYIFGTTAYPALKKNMCRRERLAKEMRWICSEHCGQDAVVLRHECRDLAMSQAAFLSSRIRQTTNDPSLSIGL
jgi:hypothetical protein